MRQYITIDGGTTNTRISLVRDGEILETLRFHVGAKSGMADRSCLADAVREGIQKLLTAHKTTEAQVECVLASGMITSEYGLYPVEQIPLPAGLPELHQTRCETKLPEITGIPFVFIRGLKIKGETLETSDMIRGEETELMGLLEPESGERLYVLPGSHDKLIEVDAQGRIVRFSTTLTGEMIAALSQNTILQDAVDLSLEKADTAYLLEGCRYARERGVNEALFKVRVLKNLFGVKPGQLYGFYMGAVLAGETDRILKIGISDIVIGGRKQIREALAALLRQEGRNVVCLSDRVTDQATVRGLIRIYEYSS